jgi:hypothetical protein
MPNRLPARLHKENKNFTTHHFHLDAPDEGGVSELLHRFSLFSAGTTKSSFKKNNLLITSPMFQVPMA